MVIGDTLTLESLATPAERHAARRSRDRDRHAHARRGSRSRRRPEIEEETELVGEGEEPRGRGARARRGGGERRRGRAARATESPEARSAGGCHGSAVAGAPSTGWSSGSAIPARSTQAPATTSASRSPTVLAERWELPQAQGQVPRPADARGAPAPGGPRVAVLMPQTYMNDAGDRSGRRAARSRSTLDHVLVMHDEIDLPFGEIRTRVGGGLAGHNGLKSLKPGARIAGLRARPGRRRAPADDRSRPRRRVRARAVPRAARGGSSCSSSRPPTRPSRSCSDEARDLD